MNNDLQSLKKLISINTQNPGTDYQFMLGYLKKYLKKKGAKINVVAKNLVATWGKPKILINAHIDTVKAIGWKTNPLKTNVKNGRISGLGACDNKGNIYCMFKATEKLPKNLMLLFSVDEEFGRHSRIKPFLNSKYAKGIKKIIVLEPTENKVVTKHPGYYSFWLTFSAKQGHSSAVKDNAILKAADAISKMKDFNVGAIESRNISGNVSAGECKIKISIRTFEKHSTIMKTIKVAAKNAKIEPSFIGLPFHNNKPFIKSSHNVRFWSEAAIFSQHGCNTILYGAGSIRQAHASDEYVTVKSLEKCISFLKKIIGEYS